jgi:O-antigen/teichoic acid export membrane protein
VFSGASLVNAIAGLATYHFIIVMAGRLMADRAQVGYLSVILSTLSPLNLLPMALGITLFPEFARRYEAGDPNAGRQLLTRSTLALQSVVTTFGFWLIVLPGPMLRLAGVPDQASTRTGWILIAWSLLATTMSAPAGFHLNATRRVVFQASVSAGFAAAGLAIGFIALPRLGIVAAGLMRAGSDLGLAWSRLIAADHDLGFARSTRIRIAASHVAIASAAGLSLRGVGPLGAVGLWTCLAMLQWSVVRDESKRWIRS